MVFFYFLFLVLLESISSVNKAKGLKTETIVGGTEVRRMDAKYIVAVMYKLSGSEDQNPCTGSILDDLFIATVAHCFFNNSGGLNHAYYYIAVSTKYVKDIPVYPVRHIKIDKVYIHSTYNPFDKDDYSSMGNIAILKLAESLGLDPNDPVHPHLAKLIPRHFKLDQFRGSHHVAGYGFHRIDLVLKEIDGFKQYVEMGTTDGLLRYGKAKVMPDSLCFEILSDIIAPGNMCVTMIPKKHSQPTGICVGDSGAPLTHRGVLDGIAINGFWPCDESQKPAIYIDVLYYLTFINNVLQHKYTNEMKAVQLVERENKFEFQQLRLIQVN